MVTPMDTRSAPTDDFSGRLIDDGAQLLRGPGLRPKVMREFRLHLGSPFLSLFPAAMFDQVAVVEVAAAVDATGRFAENFADRGVRSLFSSIGGVVGDPAQRAESARWLKQMHREVHGNGRGYYSDVRYSALNPELWTWIANSGHRFIMVTFPLCTGIIPTSAEKDAMYRFLRYNAADLELRSSSGTLATTWAEFEKQYNAIAETRVSSSPFLRDQYAGLTKLPLPTLGMSRASRSAMTPFWKLIRGYGGHLIQLCSYMTMHPAVAEAVGYRPSRAAEAEFRVIVAAMRLLWRTLPEKARTDSMIYERLQLEQMELDGQTTGAAYCDRRARFEERRRRIIAYGERYKLDSFGVPESRGGCPVGR